MKFFEIDKRIEPYFYYRKASKFYNPVNAIGEVTYL